MNTQIKKYYDKLAGHYDEDRFSNTYGQYIHAQEEQLLQKIKQEEQVILDIGCGTGRFLNYASCGIDISPNMIAVAQAKHPNKSLHVSSATKMPFENDHFDKAFSFHVFMHLDQTLTAQVLEEAHRIIKKNGTFIFDIPSRKRRQLLNYKATNWHGANALSMQEIKAMAQGKWRMKSHQGIAFFPIHRIPKRWRRYFIPLDNFFCRSLLKEWASYLVVTMEKL